MARFRGTVRGCKGEASRLGTVRSGLDVTACSWQGAVHVRLYTDAGGRDCAIVSLARHYGVGRDKLLYDGPVDGVCEDAKQD